MNGEEIKLGSKEPKVILNQGEELCEECEGKKYIEVFISRNQKMKLPCGKCGGSGKIDWIQKATGIHETQIFHEWNDSSSSISISSSTIGSYSSSGYPQTQHNISKSRLTSQTFSNNKSNIWEENLCLVLRRLQNLVKSIWVVIESHLMKPIKSGTVKILKCFKMVLTSLVIVEK
jgi:hypothetical protein